MYSPESGTAIGATEGAEAEESQKALQDISAVRIVNIAASTVGTTYFSLFCFPQAGGHSNCHNRGPREG